MPPPETVRIAVIDSGVHPAHPHVDARRLLPGVAVHRNGAIAADDTLDRLGHGTAVTAAIQEKAPGAWIVPVRVFDDKLTTTATALVAAIDWCAGAGVDFINLSLGTANRAHAEALAEAVMRAGIPVVAAREAGGVPCWPGAGDGAIGVVVDPDCPRGAFRRLGHGSYAASGEPRPIPGVPARGNLAGISFAVANVTGLLAQALANPASRSIIQKQPIAPTA
ncbi:hypothetical protein COC42_11575 [Sphingomonas spermidinifaciens]|uniref:Peptidase S8/S53 domain-containing protein n=1 Tax=Sphingomonas spermidinifaciens TaxID=1141889 RepID=A0A2A4B0Z2_9SPHN|nr:S8 family serine peptidase [Sphingomonas spermidinifaciens]PCD02111.1 hypothetical protein COC42_11575 [Sphingomonas spermidinifaciens]